MDKLFLDVNSGQTVRMMTLDPNPPDSNGVRLMTDEQVRGLKGRYSVEVITPDALPPDALVQYRIAIDGAVVAYSALVPIEEGE